ncbi:MAG: glycosyltransferase involved in cell wall biosynthesis [Candidatus Latescibacterota bacterium]|jgi:glycosyltransferase involved in cell wall biosynthesis
MKRYSNVRTKILFVSEAPIYGGAERYLITLAEGIDRSVFDLEMVISDQAPEQLRQSLADLDIPTLSIAPIRGKADWRGIRRHVTCFNARRPAIVHFNLSNSLHGQYAMLAARIAKIPVKVATLHLPPRSTTPTWRGRFFERQTICNLDMLIAVCNSSRDLVIKHFGIDEKRTTAVYNGIDILGFEQEVSQLPPAILKKENELLIGTVGRLSPQKGFDVLLNAMPAVLAKIPNARLVISGDGPEEEALKSQCKDLQIENQVDFLGWRSDIPALLQAFDLFVLPSRYESFPISILEVMAASKPIVATHVDGIPESVSEGKTGLLVPSEDPVMLADAIATLLHDPALCAQMSTQARERVETHFTLEKTARDTQAIYHQFLK